MAQRAGALAGKVAVITGSTPADAVLPEIAVP
jgi:hypothetical protein